MSPPGSDDKPKAKGPAAQPDVFVGLLFVAVAALLFGISFLAMELEKYGWQLAPR